jgi:tetratricopeptide (TPR) repeat protein
MHVLPYQVFHRICVLADQSTVGKNSCRSSAFPTDPNGNKFRNTNCDGPPSLLRNDRRHEGTAETRLIAYSQTVLLRLLLLLPCALTIYAQQPLDRAWQLAANGQRAEAVQLLEQLIGSNPKNADARLLLGSLLMEDGKQGESIAQLKAAVQLRPLSEIAQNALGEAYLHFGETKPARAAFERAVALKPAFGIAQSNFGQTLLLTGDVAEAVRHLDRAIALLGRSDDAADAYYLRAKIYADASDPQHAAKQLEQAVSIRPQFAEAWSDLGESRKMLLNDAGALTAFEHAVSADPRDAVAQYRLGAEYLRERKPRLAVDHLQTAYQLNPEDQSTLNSLQMAFRENGDSEAADRVKYELADLLRQRDQIVQNKLAAIKLNNEGAALEKTGNLRAAIEKYRAASELDPKQTGIRTNYGVALLRLGQWQEGLEQLHTALLQTPNDDHLRAAIKDALAQVPPALMPAWGQEIQRRNRY